MSVISLTHLLSAPRGPEVVAIHDRQEIAFAQFRSDVRFNARRIAVTGCQRGLLIAEDGYWAAVGLFAILYAGAEAILPPNSRPGTVAEISPEWDFIISDQVAPSPTLQLLFADGLVENPLGPLPGDCRVSFFTSGSSGQRKRVVRSLAALEAEVMAVDHVLDTRVPMTSVVHGSVSHQHVYGLLFRILWPIATGRAFNGFMHSLWDTVLGQLGPQGMLVTGPAHLARLSGIRPLAPECRPSLVLSAGSPLPESAAADARQILGCAPLEIFGSTETGAAAYRWRTAPDPVWRPLPLLRVDRAVDGTMLVGGPSVDDAPVKTADRIAFDGDGFRFLGRTDRIVKVEGKRVSLPELEVRLRQLEWVADAAAVLIGEAPPQLAAVIVLGVSGQEQLAALGEFRLGRQLRRALSDTFETASLPRRWRFVDMLPIDSMGKRNRSEIERLFHEADLVAGSPAPAARPRMPELRGTAQAENSVTLDLWIPPDLAQLEGHFPEQPIIPGVVQIDWAVKLAAQHLGVTAEPARRFQVKFRRVTLPGALIQLVLRHEPQRHRLVFEYRRGDELLTSGAVKRDPS